MFGLLTPHFIVFFGRVPWIYSSKSEIVDLLTWKSDGSGSA